MELYQLRTFIEVARTGNLTGAAAQLNLSQPAASAHLKALEHEIGFQLFHRTPKGMSLTDKGAKLLVESNNIMTAFKSFQQIAIDLHHDPVEPIRIGLNTDGMLLRVQEFVELLSAQIPQAEFHFIETKSENFMTDLESGTISAGFFYGEARNPPIKSIKLCTFRMTVVYPNSWEIPSEEEAMDYFAGKPWIWTTQGCPFYRQSIDYFARRDATPKRIMYVDDELLIGDLVQQEVGCSLLAEPIAMRFTKANKLKAWNGLDLTIDLHFGYANHLADPLWNQIGDIVKRMWA